MNVFLMKYTQQNVINFNFVKIIKFYVDIIELKLFNLCTLELYSIQIEINLTVYLYSIDYND